MHSSWQSSSFWWSMMILFLLRQLRVWQWWQFCKELEQLSLGVDSPWMEGGWSYPFIINLVIIMEQLFLGEDSLWTEGLLDLLDHNHRQDHHNQSGNYHDQLYQSKLTIFCRHVFCGDYIFSGHTMTLVILPLHHIDMMIFWQVSNENIPGAYPLGDSAIPPQPLLQIFKPKNYQNFLGASPSCDSEIFSPFLEASSLALPSCCCYGRSSSLAVKRALFYW